MSRPERPRFTVVGSSASGRAYQRPNPDRLGDAIREMANTMAEHGRTSLTFALIRDGTRVDYEVRRLNPEVDVIEIQAFGPESEDPRLMAE